MISVVRTAFDAASLRHLILGRGNPTKDNANVHNCNTEDERLED